MFDPVWTLVHLLCKGQVSADFSCLSTLKPANSAADFVACRCASVACAGTVSTQPNWQSLSLCTTFREDKIP